MTNNQLIYLPFKRILDILLSITALIILSPLFLVVSFLIKLDSKGPAFFKQKRVGKDNSYFYILKFRTMRIETPSESSTDELRNAYKWITPVGKILRKTSVDELPQLINILKGQMSIVGPRPALWNQFNLNELRNKGNVNILRPGLTGLAQINGRDENNDAEKVYWDIIYLNEFNFMFDVVCVGKTVISVFRGKGVNDGGI